MRQVMFEICVLLYSLISSSVKAETLQTTNSCLTTDKDRIQLKCNPREVIHVVSFLYQTASDCNTVDGDCQVLQQSFDDVMLPSCNGHQTCEEIISNSKINETCNHASPVYVTVTYECIADSPVDVCTETSQTFDQQLYLISPDYLNKPDDFPLVPCECTVSGCDMTVEILEVNLPFFPLEDRANITLLGDSGSWSSYPVPNALQYNKLVLNQTENILLFLDARGKTKQLMWLRLQGLVDISVQCNRQSTSILETTLTTLAPTTPPLNVQSDTAVANVTNTDANTEIPTVVIGILSGIIVVLVLVIAALLFFFLFIKPRRISTEEGRNHVTGQSNATDVTTNDTDPGYYNVTDATNSAAAMELKPSVDVMSGSETYENMSTEINEHLPNENYENPNPENYENPTPENYEQLTTYANEPTDHHYSSLK